MLAAARLLTFIQFAMFLGFGLWGFADPVGLARKSDIIIEHSHVAMAEFRAFYGGASMAIAGLLGLAMVRGRWADALIVQIVVYGAIVSGRLVHWAMSHGQPLERQTAILLAIEATSGLAAMFLLRTGNRSDVLLQ